ncbi:flagellar basal body-associated protein FliL [Nonomuraea africana]|uniref:Flagellar basal body-associated protein FliL n=1 Tax=Nonomuraea africana TaxID=46171 RepID=A0ABR9KSX2_9ACTN|nr:flagellar basal body-associated protein FliL [Nonomuraea africana]
MGEQPRNSGAKTLVIILVAMVGILALIAGLAIWASNGG